MTDLMLTRLQRDVYDWKTCAYCGSRAGSADPCCTDCRRDWHAHCPSWPSCTRDDYGRPCAATKEKA